MPNFDYYGDEYGYDHYHDYEQGYSYDDGNSDSDSGSYQSESEDDDESDGLGALDHFFARFQSFDYRDDTPVIAEYRRLSRHEGWKRGSEESKEMYEEFRFALIEEFNNIYGMDEDDIESWQYLCTMLDVDPVPDDLEDCREIVLSTHVNLVDLLDAHRTGRAVRIFETEEELSRYTIATRKFFPLDEAKEGGVLRYLLRHILS
ncbi:hypothetical protein QCA50_010837 [Cerrena zonata]|uniref:Uncharacterized protein n=1 Tax=Cerrena zonata TaxID=2478898 RepID=A0AAW0G8U7_9APHY